MFSVYEEDRLSARLHGVGKSSYFFRFPREIRVLNRDGCVRQFLLGIRYASEFMCRLVAIVVGAFELWGFASLEVDVLLCRRYARRDLFGLGHLELCISVYVFLERVRLKAYDHTATQLSQFYRGGGFCELVCKRECGAFRWLYVFRCGIFL